MTCIPIAGPGGLTGIVCTRGEKRPKPCRYCRQPSTRLCDYPLRGAKKGKTCDIALCDRCAATIAGADFCRPHEKLWRDGLKELPK